jgi:uncharacterized protein YfcZ (UPF0381/DUF406 family)
MVLLEFMYWTDVVMYSTVSCLLGIIVLLINSFRNTQKLNCMSTEAQEIKQALEDAKAKVAKVAADVALLHSKIDALPNTTELAEIKALSAELNTSLQAVDDSTPDETVTP